MRENQNQSCALYSELAQCYRIIYIFFIFHLFYFIFYALIKQKLYFCMVTYFLGHKHIKGSKERYLLGQKHNVQILRFSGLRFLILSWSGVFC